MWLTAENEELCEKVVSQVKGPFKKVMSKINLLVNVPFWVINALPLLAVFVYYNGGFIGHKVYIETFSDWTFLGVFFVVSLIEWVIGFQFTTMIETRVSLDVAKGKDPQPFVSSYKLKDYFRRSVFLNILRSVFTLFWSLFFIVPGIFKFYSYVMASYIMVENPEISPLEAIRKSKKMMKGHNFELLSLQHYSRCRKFYLGCNNGFFMRSLYAQVATANFYLKLKEEQAETK